MRILITNLYVKHHSGSESVVELLAEGLRRAGHEPTIDAPVLGEQADAMRQRGFRLVDRIGQVDEAPDVIHAQHLTPCLAAMTRFPTVPVIYNCHSAYFTIEAPLLHSQIRRYVAVDELCAVRCRERGVPPDRLSVLLNAVDLDRFARRPPLPPKPRRALLLTKDPGHRALVMTACADAGLHLDQLGPGAGKVVPDVQNHLANYDIVFATARMALEAAVTGCAVVVCDHRGFAGLLTSRNLAAWRPMNFGAGILTQPETVESLRAAIAAYDTADAASVTSELRRTADAKDYVRAYLDIYREAIAAPAPSADAVAAATAFWAEELAVTTADRTWQTLAREHFGLRPTDWGASAGRIDAALSDMQAALAGIDAKIDHLGTSAAPSPETASPGLLARLRRAMAN